MKRALHITLPLLVATAILYFLYRDFQFSEIRNTLRGDIGWEWIALGIICGVASQTTRALRWKLLLDPLNEPCRRRNLISAVYMSFALSLIIPRIGEFSRCATISKTDKVSFTKSFGTVVVERITDTIILLALIGCITLWQWQKVSIFLTGRDEHPTSTPPDDDSTSWLAYAVALAVVLAGIFIIRYLNTKPRFRRQWNKFKEGLLAFRHIRNIPLFIGSSLLVCFFNFANLWLMFYAFPFTSGLGIETALLAFGMLTFALVIPTPNGAGPWHYVIQTSLVAYGIGTVNAGIFALIVHAIHMLTIALLGFVGFALLDRKDHN